MRKALIALAIGALLVGCTLTFQNISTSGKSEDTVEQAPQVEATVPISPAVG